MNQQAQQHLKQALVDLRVAEETVSEAMRPVYVGRALTHALIGLCHALDGTIDVTVQMGNGEPIQTRSSY